MDITVIIPSYRPKEYILKCIDSISSQTLKKDKYNVIIILNGEEEPYYSTINNKIQNIENFRCVYSPKRGVSAARNLGLDLAEDSNYIVFIDDDDYISPNYLEELYNEITISNADIVQANLLVDTRGVISEDYISKAFTRCSEKKFDLILYRNFFSSVCAKIYNRKVVGDTRFREDVRIAEDAIFLFTLSYNVRFFNLVGNNAIYYRNVRIESTLRSYRSIKEIFNNYIKKAWIFTIVYLRKPFKYNLFFFLTRIMAITKTLIHELSFSLSRRSHN